ncbi:MAG TPA: sigma 54-interacting transcriptional regulator, partial [bacterium]|nr:sigma 54-interacting transcriptional regulator [bacterium]
MPVLVRKSDGQAFPLNKKLTLLGSASESDVVLPGGDVAKAHAHVLNEGDAWLITGVEGSVVVNGKKRGARYRLAPGDQVQLGSAELQFALDPPRSESKLQPMGEDRRPWMLEGYRRIRSFSQRISEKHELDAVLSAMLDDVIELMRADKGFVLLLENGVPVVKVARGPGKDGKPVDAEAQLSDSIVQRVLERREPVLVSDALNDTLFQRSKSVIDLKLSSVICVPMVSHGTLLGVIYLGNDRVANLFGPADRDVLEVFASQAAGEIQNQILIRDLTRDVQALKADAEGNAFGDLIGGAPGMRTLFRMIEKVALTDITVLIQGETGTGKELIAREIHRRSPRAKGPFISINCGAIPENLLESELFGHVRGAFTGAVSDKQGKFEAANKGTLFLDEIGEMNPLLQVKLLRALQERVIERVGDTKPRNIDIRVVCATNRVLQDEVNAGKFREDLFYRLNEVLLQVPPLRDRGEDVMILANFFLKKYVKEFNSNVKGFTPDAVLAIRKSAWPGNIRQLENKIKKAVVMAEKPRLTVEDLELSRGYQKKILPLNQAIEEFRVRYIDEVLELNNGNRTKTARDLDVDPRTVFRHLEKKSPRDGEEG